MYWGDFLFSNKLFLGNVFRGVRLLGFGNASGFGLEGQTDFSFNFTKVFRILIEREKGDSWILQLRPDNLMVLRIVSQAAAAVGSIVEF